MFDLILAVNSHNGISYKNRLPWRCPEDLKMFRQITDGMVLIMGRKTVESLPELPNRVVYCLTKKGQLTRDKNNSMIFSSLDDALSEASMRYPDKKILIAGGSEIYRVVLDDYSKQINQIHLSVIEDTSPVDTYLNIYQYLDQYNLVSEEVKPGFKYCLYRRKNEEEKQYLNLLADIIENGHLRQTRNGATKSLFGHNLKFNLQNGFPLLTTKKMFLRGIVEELLFFIRGETNSKLLESKNVNIWKGNTERKFLDQLGMTNRREGVMGPLYGYQWRNFNAPYDEDNAKPNGHGVDQLKNLIEMIKTDPHSRRLIMTDFNPLQVRDGVLYPCHSIVIQFYVCENYLDMYCYNRSQDVFLGTPFNIASSALFLTLIAQIANLIPRYLHMGLGDVHIYSEHFSKVKFEQLVRVPYQFPKLVINKQVKSLTDIENLTSDDISVKDYISYPTIKAIMIV
jgi:dihydrofolate reductase/thymidylate synthase